MKKEVVNVFEKRRELGNEKFVDFIVGLSDEELKGIIRTYIYGKIPKERAGKNEKVLKSIEHCFNLGWSFNDGLEKIELMKYYYSKYSK